MQQSALKFLKKDPKLAKVIKQVGSFEIKIQKNRYQSLVEAIINQQKSGSAAKSITKRIRGIYSSKFPKPIDVVRTSNPKLRKTGLSGMKVLYIKELSKKIDSGEVKMRTISKLDNDEIIEILTRVKGIGRWTAEMFLIFSLGRMDVLPVDDLGLKKGIQLLYSMNRLPTKQEMERFAKKWQPFRSVATWYLWKSLKKFDAIG